MAAAMTRLQKQKIVYLDDVQTHVDDVLSTGAVVSGSGVALESITKITTVQVMVPQVIMASPVEREQNRGGCEEVDKAK